MRRALVVLAFLLCAATAGCSAKPDPAPSASDFDGLGATASSTTGVILGVVVDEAVRPVPDATVTVLLPTGEAKKTSDAQGRFAFGGVQPGTYILKVTHLLYASSQTTVEVVAGVQEPPVTRILLVRLFTQEAYSERLKFDGFIQCGYSTPQIETQCVDDYSRFVVNGGLAPQLKSVADHRFYLSAIGGGWQTSVLELAWEPTAQGTSQEMFLSTSYYNRTGTDWFADVTGASPLLARLEVGQAHPTHSGSPDKIPAEGIPDLYTFAGIHGDVAAVGLSQPFTLFQTNFYFGSPPDAWSFVAGDPPPF